MLEGLGAGWTASFLTKVYPKVSLVRDVWSREFRERTGDAAHRRTPEPAVRWTSNTDCDYPRKLGRTNEIDTLYRADERERERERVRNLDKKKSTDSWNKIRDLRHTLIQYLLQQNRFGTGEDETIEREGDVR